MKIKLPFILFTMVTLLLITGCPSSDNDDLGDNGVLPPEIGTDVGNLAPGFTLKDLNGENVSLSSFAGQPVVLNFWAISCSPCRDEMPHFQQVQDEYSGTDLVILTINLSDSVSAITDFMEDNGYSFTVLLDTVNAVTSVYDVTGIPTTFFIDSDGVIQAKKRGSFSSTEEIDELLTKIID